MNVSNLAFYIGKSTNRNVAVYTFNFTENTGGLKVIDLVGDLSARLLADQSIALSKPAEFTLAAKTRVYLAIILRQNTAETSLTPAVEEYTLFAGYRDDTKFEED